MEYKDKQDESGFKVGDRVIVVNKKAHANWPNSWIDEMNKAIYEGGTINLLGDRGIIIEFDYIDCNYSFPYTALHRLNSNTTLNVVRDNLLVALAMNGP
mgnify:CR=1 FL=1